MTLSTQSNFPDPDAAYRLVVEAHRGLSDEQSASLDTALGFDSCQSYRGCGGPSRGGFVGKATPRE